MSAIEMRAPGGPETLWRADAEVPQPGASEVLIRVAGAGINAADIAQRRGRYDPPPGASPRLGLEVSGDIAALGSGTSRWAVGDRVVALCNGGGYAEFVAVPEGQVLPLPAGWTLLDGAALPETFFTVEQTLVMRASLSPGMTVLIHGAAGGVGGTAIGVASFHGAKPIAIVSTADKAAYAKSLGAWAVIDRTTEDFVARTLTLTDGRGADRVVDVVGGVNLAHSIEAAAVGGHIMLLATLGGPRAEINAGLLVSRQLTVSGSMLRPQSRAAKAAIAESLEKSVWPALADGRIVPPRVRFFRFAAAGLAHQTMEQRANFGKIVLVTPFGESLAEGIGIAG